MSPSLNCTRKNSTSVLSSLCEGDGIATRHRSPAERTGEKRDGEGREVAVNPGPGVVACQDGKRSVMRGARSPGPVATAAPRPRRGVGRSRRGMDGRRRGAGARRARRMSSERTTTPIGRLRIPPRRPPGIHGRQEHATWQVRQKQSGVVTRRSRSRRRAAFSTCSLTRGRSHSTPCPVSCLSLSCRVSSRSG